VRTTGLRAPRRSAPARFVAALALAALAAIAAVPAATAAAAPQRGYELVGPPGDANYTVQGFAAQPDGEALYWTNVAGEQTTDPAPADGALGDVFLARRSAGGWNSTWLTPDPAGKLSPRDTSAGLPAMRADGFVFFSSGSWADPGGAGPSALYLGGGSSPSTLLSAAPGTPAQAGLDDFQWLVSEDLSTAVFSTTAPLDPGDTDANADIYARRGDTLTLISKNTDGTADNTAAEPFLPQAVSGNIAGTGGDGALSFATLSRDGFPVSQGASPVSPDGRTIVFSTTAQLDPADTDTVADLYLWREGQGVSLISDDERTAPGCPTVPGSTTDCTGATADVSFVGMSEDASVIYLRTREGLVDGDTDGGNDIYECRVGEPAGHRLTLASGPGAGNEVWPVTVTPQGLLFFAATDRLGVDPPTGTGPVLYHWDGTAIETVSALTNADVFTGNGLDLVGGGIASPSPAQRAVRATADGSALLFRTTGALDPADTDTAADLYLWRAGHGVTLVSGTGPAPVALGTPESAYVAATYPAYGGGRAISADGSRVFFTSPDALSDEAGDNGRAKLYEWLEGDGIHLISPAGNDAGAVSYIDNGADGTDVFFMTGDSLVGVDTDGGGLDTYDARIGGGFPGQFPAPEPAPCAGDACQGPRHRRPAPPAAGSLSFAGEGNPPLVPGRASVGVAKARSVTGTAAKLKVRVPGPGRITVAGSQVRARKVPAPKAGSYPVRVALDAKAKKALQRKKKLTVKARVSYRTEDGRSAAKVVSVTFRQPGAKAPAGKGTTTRKGH